MPVATAVYVTKKQMSAENRKCAARRADGVGDVYGFEPAQRRQYVNVSQSLVGTSGALALAALACLLALSWADERLPKAGGSGSGWRRCFSASGR